MTGRLRSPGPPPVPARTASGAWSEGRCGERPRSGWAEACSSDSSTAGPPPRPHTRTTEDQCLRPPAVRRELDQHLGQPLQHPYGSANSASPSASARRFARVAWPGLIRGSPRVPPRSARAVSRAGGPGSARTPASPRSDQQIRDPLHALPGDAHLAGDPGDGERPWQYGSEDLPPGRGQPGGPSQLLRDGEELAVQPEDAERGPAEQLRGRPAALCAGSRLSARS